MNSSKTNSQPVPLALPQPAPRIFYPDALRDGENKLIESRRQEAGVPNEQAPRIGLALSGGGIRSATFCLGVLQGLAGCGLLRKLDFLSTVSGGGYAGSFLGRMFMREWINESQPQKPPGMTQWPAGVCEAVKIEGPGFQAKRVEAVLGNNGSAPMQWLRDCGRYIAPAGGGDLLLAGAVAVRNGAALLLVVISTLLAVFLTGTTLRAVLWHWPRWKNKVEIPLLTATCNHHWWWSPLLFLPAIVFLCFTLPLGWAYWLTQKDRGKWQIRPWYTVLLVIALGAAVFYYAVWHIPATSGRCALVITSICVILAAVLALAYHGWAMVLAKNKIKPPVPNDEKSATAAKDLKAEAGQQRLNLIRNDLSLWFATAFIGFVTLTIFAVVDSLGQMAYALFRPTHGPGLPGFLGVTGLLVLFGLAKRIKLLLDQLPDRKTAQMPVSVLITVAAVVLAGILLVSVSAAAHGFAWQWKNPVVANPPRTASTTNDVNGVCTASNLIPVLNLAKQLPGKYDVKLTSENLVQVTEAPDKIDVSPLATEMSVLWAGIAWGVCLLLTFCFGHTLTFLNLSSHQALYSARLSRAYHGASNPERWFGQGQRISDALPADDVLWRQYQPQKSGCPLHLVNVTLNETVAGKTQIEYLDRQGLIVALGPAGITVGTQYHALWDDQNHAAAGAGDVDMVQPLSSGYHPLSEGRIGGLPSPHPIERLSLRQWIGISGAAFTTGMGQGTSIAKSFLLGLSNIRLGYWWDSYVGPAARKKALGKTYVSGAWRRHLLAWAFPVQTHLFDEFLARFHGPNSRLWYLSDGGHYEDTAAYELIRRRVPCIIVCDCGCDPDYSFEDLGHLVRMARVDFGAEIEFLDAGHLAAVLGDESRHFGSAESFAAKSQPPGKNADDKPAAPAQPHALLGRVWYDNADRKSNNFSWLVVLKPGLSGDETLDVAQYHTAYPDFPQETTLDQFFDEAQWESYRKLGHHIATQVFEKKESLPFLAANDSKTA